MLKRAQNIFLGLLVGALVFGPFAMATDGTNGTSGPAMLDYDTDQLFDSQDPPHYIEIPGLGQTLTLSGHSTSTLTGLSTATGTNTLYAGNGITLGTTSTATGTNSGSGTFSWTGSDSQTATKTVQGVGTIPWTITLTNSHTHTGIYQTGRTWNEVATVTSSFTKTFTASGTGSGTVSGVNGGTGTASGTDTKSWTATGTASAVGTWNSTTMNGTWCIPPHTVTGTETTTGTWWNSSCVDTVTTTSLRTFSITETATGTVTDTSTMTGTWTSTNTNTTTATSALVQDNPIIGSTGAGAVLVLPNATKTLTGTQTVASSDLAQQTPETGKIPLAQSGGTIANGWIDATSTPTASKIPIADGSGKLDGWVGSATPYTSGVVKAGTDAKIGVGWLPTVATTAMIPFYAGGTSFSVTPGTAVSRGGVYIDTANYYVGITDWKLVLCWRQDGGTASTASITCGGSPGNSATISRTDNTWICDQADYTTYLASETAMCSVSVSAASNATSLEVGGSIYVIGK